MMGLQRITLIFVSLLSTQKVFIRYWKGLIAIYPLQADYDIFVGIHSFTNPTEKCPVCRNDPLQPFGCCDRFDEVNECTGDNRCDYIFYYCNRPLGSPPNTDPHNIASCQITVPSLNEVPDFNRSVVQQVSNPLKFETRPGSWRVSW